MKLTEEEIAKIASLVKSKDLKLKGLEDDIIDHLCCVVESEINDKESFDEILSNALEEIAPNGLVDLGHKTFYLLNSKRILIMKKITYLIGFMGAFALASGASFKLLHLPGADELFMGGYIIFLLIFAPLLAFDKFKVAIARSFSDRLKIIIGVIASVILGISGIFKIFHLQGADVLLMTGLIVFSAFFLPTLFFTMYKKSVS